MFIRFRQPMRANSMKPCNNIQFNQRPNQICDYEEYLQNRKGYLIIRIVNNFDTRRMSFWDRILEENYDEDYEYEY